MQGLSADLLKDLASGRGGKPGGFKLPKKTENNPTTRSKYSKPNPAETNSQPTVTSELQKLFQQGAAAARPNKPLIQGHAAEEIRKAMSQAREEITTESKPAYVPVWSQLTKQDKEIMQMYHNVVTTGKRLPRIYELQMLKSSSAKPNAVVKVLASLMKQGSNVSILERMTNVNNEGQPVFRTTAKRDAQVNLFRKMLNNTRIMKNAYNVHVQKWPLGYQSIGIRTVQRSKSEGGLGSKHIVNWDPIEEVILELAGFLASGQFRERKATNIIKQQPTKVTRAVGVNAEVQTNLSEIAPHRSQNVEVLVNTGNGPQKPVTMRVMLHTNAPTQKLASNRPARARRPRSVIRALSRLLSTTRGPVIQSTAGIPYRLLPKDNGPLPGPPGAQVRMQNTHSTRRRQLPHPRTANRQQNMPPTPTLLKRPEFTTEPFKSRTNATGRSTDAAHGRAIYGTPNSASQLRSGRRPRTNGAAARPTARSFHTPATNASNAASKARRAQRAAGGALDREVFGITAGGARTALRSASAGRRRR